jgi:hypothetical protein
MSDHDDAWASLGSAGVSAVHDPVGDAIPELNQSPENGCHVTSSVGLEESGRVLDDGESRAGGVDEFGVLTDESGELVEVSGSSASEPCTMRCGDAGVLAGESADDDVWASDLRSVNILDVLQ